VTASFGLGPVSVRPKLERRSSARTPGAGFERRPAPRILLVDHHPAVAEGLALVLEADGAGNCRQAGGRAEALDAVRRQPPDVAVVGLSVNTEDGLALLRDLRARRIPALACSRHESAAQVKRALAAGARGYITEREAPRGIALAVRGVLAGWLLVSPRAVEGLEEEDRQNEAPRPR
jgi:DNA-binding NarL/FixJ family response regulator